MKKESKMSSKINFSVRRLLEKICLIYVYAYMHEVRSTLAENAQKVEKCQMEGNLRQKCVSCEVVRVEQK